MPQVDYSRIRAGDVVLTASSNFRCRLIRLGARWNIADMFRMDIPNHIGIVIEDDECLAIAEMLSTGLEINPLEDYTRDWKHHRIVGVKRHPGYANLEKVERTESVVRSWWHYGVAYGTLKLLKFIGIDVDNCPKSRYCSELVELAANGVNLTWAAWPLLKGRGARRRISPYDIWVSPVGSPVEWQK